LQCSIAGGPTLLSPGIPGPNKKAAGKPAALRCLKASLFGGDLSRRVERAGIVDLRDLMVGKAENLSQDFVGMLT
jgi:hypothetical protein